MLLVGFETPCQSSGYFRLGMDQVCVRSCRAGKLELASVQLAAESLVLPAPQHSSVHVRAILGRSG